MLTATVPSIPPPIASGFIAAPIGASRNSGVFQGSLLSNSVIPAAAPSAPPPRTMASIVPTPVTATSKLSGGKFALTSISSTVSAPSSAMVSTSLAAAPAASVISYQFVPVGNPGNANDPSTGNLYGSVNYSFDIGQFDITLYQYATFLNAVAKADGFSLYNTNLATNATIAGITRTGASGSYQYTVTGDGNRPVTYVTWFDAARLANWMQNGQPTGLGEVNGSTEDGAYPLHGALAGVINKSPNAMYWIPTENEWYKAAYYDPTLNGGAGGYWTNATMGNGILGNTIGNQLHQANYNNGTFSTGGVNGFLTDVGAFSMSLSAYGIYDASGDVYQWNDAVVSSNSRGLRGGAWDSTSSFFLLSSDRSYSNPNFASSDLGFRLAMVPEPSPLVALVGGAALLFAGRRRRALR